MKKTLALALAFGPVSLAAQLPADTTRADTAALEWIPIGSPAEDRLRTAQLLGEEPSRGHLIRSVSSYAAPRAEGVRFLRPHVRAVWNSYLPVSANEGLAWSGRGAGFHAAAGVRARFGRVTVIAAPEVAYTQNRDFQRIPANIAEGRSEFAHPFHGRASSLDAPLRFGDDPVARISLGQSSVTAHAGAFAGGVATENLWWGPGVRNALVMSNNAPGFPHLFVRTSAEGLRTRFGTVQGRWVAGGLSQSSYFDDEDEGRTLAAIALAFTPRGEPGLTLGATRAVYRAASPWSAPLRFLDVLVPVRHPKPAAFPAVEEAAGKTDQLFALFGRWVFPESGFEMYGEWARQEGFGSLRELLTAPDATRGYTLGLQWASPGARAGRLRVQAELTSLEQNDAVRNRPQSSFYTSANVPQGYTHRGRVIGAAIGPGSSQQWGAADYLRRDWRLGVFAARTRWDEDALARISTRNPRGHDVQGIAGVRGARRVAGWEVAAEYSFGRRLNWLFQNTARAFNDFDSVDVNLANFVLTVSPSFR